MAKNFDREGNYSLAEKYFKEKFEIIHFIDSARWQKASSYNTINCAYSADEMTTDEKILTSTGICRVR